MEAYKGNENRNSVLIISDFPVLVPGDNEISFTGFTKVEITPRWWVL
jgi:phage-related protein